MHTLQLILRGSPNSGRKSATDGSHLRMTSMRVGRCAHTFSNGGLIVLRVSSHSGTGRFLLRMKSGLNSFD